MLIVSAKVFLLLILCVAASKVIAVPHLHRRIIGGFDVPDSAAPWAARLVFTSGTGSSLCAGTFISQRHIITAAHCVIGPSAVYPVQNTTVGCGSSELTKQTKVMPVKITPHPYFGSQSNININDIAVVEIPNAHNVQPAAIYMGTVGVHESVLAVGWGATTGTNDPRSAPSRLRGAYLKVGQECRRVDPVMDGSRICTLNKYTVGRATCKGDSGGGLFVLANSTVLLLAGLDSQGGRIGDPTCGTADGYSLFTRIKSHMKFIGQATGIVF
ncbi:trypsin-like cysteine/serine peptidase domain-containing protein [Coemansia spiralis]|nr:trypsin-like cysteine/serine peptidase domain-containing protein [Coemansia spiralis]